MFPVRQLKEDLPDYLVDMIAVHSLQVLSWKAHRYYIGSYVCPGVKASHN